MIRVLLGAGSAAAANGITADVDVLLDAGAAEFGGDDFTVNLTLDEGAATGEAFTAGLDKSVALSIAGGEVTAAAEIVGTDEIITVTFADNGAPAIGANLSVSGTLNPGIFGAPGLDETISSTLSAGGAPATGFSSTVNVALVAGDASVGVGVDADAAAYIAAVEAADDESLEAAVKQAINLFVLGLKDDGIWGSISTTALLIGPRTLAGAEVPLKGSAPTFNGIGTGDYSRINGISTNGSSTWIDTNRAANAEAQNDYHMCLYRTSGTRSIMMSSAATDSNTFAMDWIADASISDTMDFRSRRSTFNSWNCFNDTTGFIGLSRPVSTGYDQRINNFSRSVTAASDGRRSDTFKLARGSSSQWGQHTFAWYSIGASINMNALRARVRAYVNAIQTALDPGGDITSVSDFSHEYKTFATFTSNSRFGFVFTVGTSDLTCIGLGLFQTTAASENVRIHRVSDGALIAEANIATATNWNDVSISPVTLVASTQYVISARAGGDSRTVPRNYNCLLFTDAIGSIAYRVGSDDNQPTTSNTNSYAFARFEFTQ
jgi:hypothetical protein